MWMYAATLVALIVTITTFGSSNAAFTFRNPLVLHVPRTKVVAASFGIANKFSVSLSKSPRYAKRKRPDSNKPGGNRRSSQKENDEEEDKTAVSKGGENWIEKSSPVGIGLLTARPNDEEETVEYYDLKLSGADFLVGPLSKRMSDALLSIARQRFPNDDIPPELLNVYNMYAMDNTAKESTRAALARSGLDFQQRDDEQMTWGDMDSIDLVSNGKTETYASIEEAVEFGNWQPGQSFDFLVRNVPAKLKELDLSELLNALDPQGTLRSEAKEKGILMPDEEIVTLRQLGDDCERRCKAAHRETEGEDSVFRGIPGKRGYSAVLRSDLLAESGNLDGTENSITLMHVMDAFVNHGCLIVDVTDGGTSFLIASKIAKMWNATESFFSNIDADNNAMLPGMDVAKGSGSRHAVVGYTSYDDGKMQFLESRIRRKDGALLPSEIQTLIGTQGCLAMTETFHVISDVGRDLVRIATTAASIEAGAFLRPQETFNKQQQNKEDLPFISGLTMEDAEASDFGSFNGVDKNDESLDRLTPNHKKQAAILASKAATLLAEEIMDDGKLCDDDSDQDSTVSMSPHRMCRYSDTSKSGGQETFGAHTDTSFVTIVPVAAVSGLEVYDEDAGSWYRPELMARQIWEHERSGSDVSALTETIADSDGKEVVIPWYSRYLLVLPGELLQLVTRNDVPAAVHRVITDGASRISAPVLLRARNGKRMNVEKYLGSVEKAGPLLLECHGMKMEDIHDAMQPSSFQ